MAKRIGVVLSVLLVIAVAGCLLFVRHQSNAYRSYIAELKVEARPYEQEMKELREELGHEENAYFYGKESGTVLVGYYITQDSDLNLIRRQASGYDFSPALVTEYVYDMDLLSRAARTRNDTVLIGQVNTYDELDLAKSRSDAMNTSVFLLRQEEESTNVLNALAEHGFTACVRHAGGTGAPFLDNGMVSFRYCFVNDSRFDMESALQSLKDDKSILMFVFNLAYLESETLTEDAIAGYLDQIQEAVEAEELTYGRVTSVVDELAEARDNPESYSTAFEEYQKDIQKKIDKLQAQIDEIYGRWDAR